MAITYRSVLASGGSLEVDSISITTQPTKTSYIQGDTIDITGMVVTAIAGPLSGDVTNLCTVTPQQLNTSGTQEITVSYGGKTATFNVTVTAATIAITTAPTKTAYIVGDELDLTGIVVTRTAGGNTDNVTSMCTFSPADGTVLDEAGSVTITATLGNLTATTSVTAYAYSAISITTQPTKTEYFVGDFLDLTGIVVTATAGTLTRDVTALCSFSPANGSALSTSGSITVTATFNGLTDTTSVTAYAISGIAITTPPTKTKYKPNQQLDLTGIVVTATAGTLTRDVTSQCTFSPADGTTLTTEGTFTLTATYEGFTATTTYKVASFTLVPWSTGTDEEIAAMVDAYYAGDCTLADIQTVWSVGDERTVSLAAMAATGVGESHVAQNQTFVIMNFGGKKLSSDHSTDVLAVIGQKNCLANNGTIEDGYMNSSNDNTGGWNACARRTWCNSVYKNAIPSDFRAIFKEFDNVTADGSGSTTATSADYFAMASEKEVFGSVTYANATAETANSQFSYYVTAANRIKYRGDGGSANIWWERSPYSGNTTYFCRVGDGGNAGSSNASVTRGLAPFGCI